MEDSDEKKWDFPAHTKAKHDILQTYLGGWYPKLASWSGRLVYLDGFAGRGRYVGGAEGSPLVALRTLVEHQAFNTFGRRREFVFLFVEANKANAENLQQEIKRLKDSHAEIHGSWPTNVHAEVRNERFDQSASDIIATLQEQKKRLAPTFAFVDPFGYTGLPMDLLADLLASQAATELFVNVMMNHVQRFVHRDGQERAIKELFGMPREEVLSGFDADHGNPLRHLHDVYARQLRERVGMDYVNSFEMRNTTGNVSYYLFHATRHVEGVRLMKGAMWKVDPGGGYAFHDRFANQDVLFEASPPLRPLQEALRSHFAGRRGVSIPELLEHALLRTPYRDTHVRPALTALEKAGLIQVNSSAARRRAGDFPAATTSIDFF